MSSGPLPGDFLIIRCARQWDGPVQLQGYPSHPSKFHQLEVNKGPTGVCGDASSDLIIAYLAGVVSKRNRGISVQGI